MARASRAHEHQPAIRYLRCDIAPGYRNAQHFRTNPDRGGLRQDPAFHLLQLDLEVPSDPFATWGRGLMHRGESWFPLRS